MNSHFPIRSFVPIAVCFAVSVAAPVSFGADKALARAQTAQAQLLDHAEFLCDNCFFGPSDYYYCFAVDNQILVGYQRTPVMNWQDKSKNYLTAPHHSWTPWTTDGQNVPISYDDKYIWVARTDGNAVKRGFGAHVKAAANWVSRGNSKKVRLKRSSLRDIFINNDRCRNAGASKVN